MMGFSRRTLLLPIRQSQIRVMVDLPYVVTRPTGMLRVMVYTFSTRSAMLWLPSAIFSGAFRRYAIHRGDLRMVQAIARLV